MSEVVTILAELNGEHKEIYKVKLGKDGSLYLFFSGLKPADSYISLHTSGDFHVTRSRDGEKVYVRLPESQNLKTYKGCDSPNECVINKSMFEQYKKRDASRIKKEVFSVNLASFKTPLVGVILYLFDPKSKTQFQQNVSKYIPQQSKIVSTLLPNIGLIAHEFQSTKTNYPY